MTASLESCARREVVEDCVAVCAETDIPLQTMEKLRPFLMKHCQQGQYPVAARELLPWREESEDFKPVPPELGPVRMRECSVVLERICVREQGAGEEGSPNSTQGGVKEDESSDSAGLLTDGRMKQPPKEMTQTGWAVRHGSSGRVEELTERPQAVLTQEPAWTQIYESERVTLRCQVQGGYTDWRFTWYKAGRNAPVTQDYYSSIDGDRYTISSATGEHSGEYTCKGERTGNPSYSKTSHTLTLRVSVDTPKPVLTREPAGEIFEGDMVTLSCVVEGGSGGWRYLWYTDRQGAPVYQTDSSSGTGAGYTISAAALSHSGEYWCGAGRGRNTSYSQYSDPIWVNVTALFSRVTLTASPGATVKEGEALNLTCEAAVNKTPRPELHYTIVRDGEPVTNSTDSALYSIASTEKSHTGSYTCAVESQGVKKSSQELHIELQSSPYLAGGKSSGGRRGGAGGPPKEQLPREPPSSDGDTGPEPCVAEEGAAEPAPEAGVGSADNAEPMQATPAEGSEGREEPPQPEQELPQASLSRGDGGSGPRAAAEGEEETPPEAEAGSVEPAFTLVSGARKGGEEPERAEGGALAVDPLPEVQRGQETGPRPSIEGPVPVTEGAREEPLKQQPVTDAEEGEGPERVYPLSLGEGGEGPERVDPLPSREEDGPETVPRTSKEGPKAGTTRPSGSAVYVERPSAPPKSRVQTRCPKLQQGAKPPAQAPRPSESTSPPGPSKRPAEKGGKKVPATLPVTSVGGKGREGPRGGRTLRAFRKRAGREGRRVDRGRPPQENGGGQVHRGGRAGGDEARRRTIWQWVRGSPRERDSLDGTPARQGGKATRKTKHLIPTEGEERSAAGGGLPVAVAGQGTASGSLRGKRKAQACTRLGLLVRVPGGPIEGPQKRKRPPRRPPSTGDEGPGPRAATEGEKDPSPEAVLGSAESAEPMEEAPAERPKGWEEPARATEALRVDPLPVTQLTSEAGPESTIEGPVAEEVAEGAQEGPPKEQLPRAPSSSGSDTGPEPCVAEEGAAETAPEAEVGSADKAEPMQATPAEGPEGEEELPLPEQELPRAPEAGVGSADNAAPMQATPAEGSEGGAEPPQSEQELPQTSLSCGDGGSGPSAAAEGDEETPSEADVGSAEPALTLASGARKGGEEPERAEGGALAVDPLPEVQRGQETGPRPSIEGPVPVTEGVREEPLKELPPRASLSGGDEGSGPCAAVGGETSPEAVPVTDAEEGEGPERVYPLSLGEGGEGLERVDPLPSRKEDGPETVPRTSKEGPRAGTTRPSGSAVYVERPSAPPKSRGQTVPARVPPPISPAASPGGGAGGVG
ncbi:UNVERIFIED_CONTAM: hypothetical protein FKN15_071256 [Acipenser sinensis]